MRILFLLLFTLNLSACYHDKASIDNTLVYCTESNPTLFNPQLSHDVASLDATTHQLFNRLVQFDAKTNDIIPDLAEHWEISEDKLRYRFILRDQIHFHQTPYFNPTRTLNADDVLFSFNRMHDKSHSYYYVNRDDEHYLVSYPFTTSLNAIHKIDDRTVEFVLNKPDSNFLQRLAAHYGVIQSSEYAQQLLDQNKTEQIDHFPIGTGPFKFKSYDEARGIIRYQKNTSYWQSQSNIDNLIYVTNPSATKRYTKLLSGECDIISYPAASQLDNINEHNNIKLISETTSNVALWAFNTKSSLVSNAKIRTALSQAIDKKTILSAVYYQSASKTNTLLSKDSWALDAKVHHDIYNPKEANKILHDEHYDFAKSLTILLPKDGDVFNPNFHKTAELIQQNLRDVGVKSHIVSLSGVALQARLNSGDYDTYLTGFNIHINEPDSIFRPLLSCDSSPENGNSSHWCSDKTEKLLAQSLIEPNVAKRTKNYYKIQDEIRKERPYFPIAHVLRIDAVSTSIKHVEVNPLTGINLRNTTKQDLN